MAQWTGDLSDQIAQQIALETNLTVARLASAYANSICADQKKKPPKEAKSKKQVFDHVAKVFNTALHKYGIDSTEVIVAAAPGIGRGPMIQVVTKEVEE